MDPITTAIIAALTAGVASGTTEAARRSIIDAYKSLKQTIHKKYGKDNEVLEAVNNLEKSPDSINSRYFLMDKFQSLKADQDSDLVQAANHLLDLIDPTRASNGKFNIHGNDIKSVVQADNIDNLTQYFEIKQEDK